MTYIQTSPFQEQSFQRSNSQVLKSLPSINTAFYKIFNDDKNANDDHDQEVDKNTNYHTKNLSSNDINDINDIIDAPPQLSNTPPKLEGSTLYDNKCVSKNENIIKKDNQRYKVVRFLYPLPKNTIPFDVQIYLNVLTNEHN